MEYFLQKEWMLLYNLRSSPCIQYKVLCIMTNGLGYILVDLKFLDDLICFVLFNLLVKEQ